MKTNQRVAIVTGGGKGIGAACCRALAMEGFYVGINYRSGENDARQVLSDIDNQGCLLEADLSDPSQVEGMVSEIRKKMGRVDTLVNNAGVSIDKNIMTMKIEEFDVQRSVLRGAWFLVKKILRFFMLRQSSGRIINISSITGHTGNPGQIPYTMEKGAMDAMTKSLAKELTGRNILVNSVAPGFIDTDMTRALHEDIREGILENIPLGRMGRSEEVAEVVAFLSTSGNYINGSVIHVNGGLYAA